MKERADYVIIGAGIVGAAAAYHLTRKGIRDVVVLDQGSLFQPGGSTSHAPGLVFQTNPCKAMTMLARVSVELYGTMEAQGQPGFYGVGSLEVAYTLERLNDLKRRIGYARSWGLEGHLLTPEQAREKLPLLDASKIQGAYFVPTDGIAKAVRLVEAFAEAATKQGASFHGRTEVMGFEIDRGHIRAVVTNAGTIRTNRVLLCAGIWGPKIGRMAGLTVPLVPVQHQYVRTKPLPALHGETREVVHPILRHQDRCMYFRQEGEAYGIGSYQHEPLLVEPDAILHPNAAPIMPSVLPFTPRHFEQPWNDAQELLPALRGAEFASSINGMFSFTPDGLPLMGESAVGGLWLAEAVWVTHAGGVAREIVQWMIDGAPSLDLRECDMHRFEPHALSKSYVRARGAQQYREVYDIVHPLQQMEQPRPLRVSPFYARQKELGAVFFEGRGWERPQWFASNAKYLDERPDLPGRTGWAARHWSPIAGAEHLITRERVALYDLSSLVRIEVTGPGALAFLERMSTNRINRPVGSVMYTAMLDPRGGVKSDMTVTRLGETRFQVGLNGPLDIRWLRHFMPWNGDVHIEEITSGTCCLGVWGPRARDLVQALSADDFSNAHFPYMHARQVFLGDIPVTAQRISYVGELGWELYTRSEYGLRLWDLLWEAGQSLGVIAAGRAAFESLRLEKGYRLWGVDMYSEHDPYEAGLGMTVKLDKPDFVGREACQRVKAQGPKRILRCMCLDNPAVVLMGKEPIEKEGRVVGHVTSATYGYSVQRSFAYGLLPIDVAELGTRVDIEFFGEKHSATVVADPLYDPKGQALRG